MLRSPSRKRCRGEECIGFSANVRYVDDSMFSLRCCVSSQCDLILSAPSNSSVYISELSPLHGEHNVPASLQEAGCSSWTAAQSSMLISTCDDRGGLVTTFSQAVRDEKPSLGSGWFSSSELMQLRPVKAEPVSMFTIRADGSCQAADEQQTLEAQIRAIVVEEGIEHQDG